ncbi:MAG: hypothetical protein BWY85_00225 [Firmicutes bacterium ADurb.Bin506]|nr:MAG: hypothetical protein BWY85_00225 [Firmicutes bacterium ADurb.Bin506]
MKVGYLACRLCGAETNCVDLTAGICPACSKEKAAELSALHRCFDRALAAADYGAASLATEEIENYERLWGIRLSAAPSVAEMRNAVVGRCSLGS